MEDPDAEETQKFVKAQNEISMPYIHQCGDRSKITEELTKLKNYPKFSVPSRHGDNYFTYLNSGLQNQSVLYKHKTLDAKPELFFDPNTLSSDGTIALRTKSFSYDGKLFAYGLSESGSDWFSIHLKDAETGEDYPDKLEKAKFSGIEWTQDGRGFFYGCYPEADDATGTKATELGHQKLYYHRVGTDQKDDVKVVEFPDHPKWMIGAEVSDCGTYVIITTHQECRDNMVFFTKLPNEINGSFTLTTVIDEFKNDYNYITNDGSKFVFETNAGAPNSKLIVFDFENVEDPKSTLTTLVPEIPDEVLDWTACVNEDKLLMCYKKDVKNVLYVHDLKSGNRLHQIPLEIGSISSVWGRKRYSEVFFMFTSIIIPNTSYRIDMTENPPKVQLLRETEIPGFRKEDYKVDQVFYTSKDGTKVPMFIASRKDIAQNGTEPCMLYGYGGFNISILPTFADSQLFFVQHYGYFVIANIRGGGEYGEKWHNQGRLLNKQNGFNDFIASAEYLIQEKYTCKDKLVIHGGSNGGLLVGACLNQRPDLFGAGIAAVGVLDMLRFHKFTVGYAWCSDFGNPELKEDFEYILKYSPLHNIPDLKDTEQYPALLLTTADHDDRVVPSHSLKFIAELHHKLGNHQNQKNPLLIRIETKAGHGAGKPMTKVIEEGTDKYAFLTQALGYVYKDL